MNIPFWLLRLLPTWQYICPKCRKTVKANSHKCPHCGEKYPLTLRVPPTFLKDPKKLEAYVHRHIFPRVSEFERNYLTKYFTVLFSDGFESGDFTAWTGTFQDSGCTITVTSTPHHGIYGATAIINGEYKGAGTYKTFSAQTTLAVRLYANFSTLPADGLDRALICILTATGELASLSVARSGANYYFMLVDRKNGGYYGWSNPLSITAGTWHCYELLVSIGASGTIAGFYDGVQKESASGLNWAGLSATRIYLGNFYSSEACTIYFDCVVVADAYIGPESSYSPKTRSSLPNTMMTMLNNKMLFSACNRFPKLQLRRP